MTVIADIAEDLQYVDGLRTVTLKVAGQSDLTIDQCLDEPPTWKEMEASNGQVRQGDTKFIWPARFNQVVYLPLTGPRYVPPPLGSVIVDDGGVAWTILTVEYKDQVNMMEATCRNLAIAAGLDNTATIIRATYEKAKGNDARPVWRNVAENVPARFQPWAEAAQIFESSEFVHDAYRVILGRTIDIDLAAAEYRLLDAHGHRYRVVQYADQERIDLLPVAIAVKITEGSEYWDEVMASSSSSAGDEPPPV